MYHTRAVFITIARTYQTVSANTHCNQRFVVSVLKLLLLKPCPH